MHAVLASLAPFASLASLSSSSMLLACCSLISLASLPCCCSPCPCRSPARLLGLLASLACSARFARCCLLLSRSLRLPAAAPTRFARLRPADVHLAATSPAAYSPRSLAVLASLAPSRFARSLLAHCSLTARSLLSLCSPDSSPHPAVPLRHDCLAARGGKLRCDSPQSLSDPHTHPFCTTLPVPIFDPSGLMARARNLDQIARAPAPGIILCDTLLNTITIHLLNTLRIPYCALLPRYVLNTC